MQSHESHVKNCFCVPLSVMYLGIPTETLIPRAVLACPVYSSIEIHLLLPWPDCVAVSVGTRTGKKATTREKWMKTPGNSTLTNKIAICSHFHLDWLQLFQIFFSLPLITRELSTVSVLKLILSRPLGIVPELRKRPRQWKIHPLLFSAFISSIKKA